MRPYGATYAYGIFLMELMVVGSGNPRWTSLDRRFRRIKGFDFADLWLPLEMASSRSIKRLELLRLSSGYFAPLVR